ncbi:aminotransferase class I/II-fold pyridoxal phosphate-dependent enzyme [Synechococcus sp. M16CYN]|uniref:aminotransferase class I/II-fold pyridoxal phosphate-dependent enzyme n=1 Tax=Synechococcus sp. M16CYN TaxID=3103139 RepID=UPI003247E175
MDTTRRRHLNSWQPGRQPWELKSSTNVELAFRDLASNDYLGLSRHPAVVEAAATALKTDGLGAGGSRLITGTRPRHMRLEAELGDWLGRERVLLFPSGFQANLAAVAALAGRHTTVLADRLVHHSLLVGVRACGAQLQRFVHNDLQDLERRLRALHSSDTLPLVISESLFSMEGTSPNLQDMASLCAQHGAQLLVDEAHGLGVLGPGGRGLCWGINDPIHLISGTFGKAFGSGGAFLAGDAVMGERLLQTSGAFRYTTALAPPLVAGAQAALNLIKAYPTWGRSLRQRSNDWRTSLSLNGWVRPKGNGPVLPLLFESDRAALDQQKRLKEHGLLSIAIRPPTVPEGTSRLRIVLRRDLPDDTLQLLLRALVS